MLIEGKFAYSIHVILPDGAREPVRILRSGFIQGSLDALLGILTTYILHTTLTYKSVSEERMRHRRKKKTVAFLLLDGGGSIYSTLVLL